MCGHGNEASGCIKTTFFDQLNDYQFPYYDSITMDFLFNQSVMEVCRYKYEGSNFQLPVQHAVPVTLQHS
jgi:hypothetical protein